MPIRSLLAAAALLASLPAAALLIRADRDDAEYLELASRYASSIRIDPIAAGGVLIAPRWILTEGASAQRLEALRPRPRLKIGAGESAVAAVFVSPDRRLGLVLLADAVRGIEPNALYRGSDERGKPVVIASHGPSGVLGGAATRTDARARAAINTIDRVTDGALELGIKPPDEASDLQGVAVDLDRGSPAYIETPEGLFVAGIAAPSQPEAQVGAFNVYLRISTAVAWIEEAMLEAAKQEMNRLLGEVRG